MIVAFITQSFVGSFSSPYFITSFLGALITVEAAPILTDLTLGDPQTGATASFTLSFRPCHENPALLLS